MRLSLSRIIGVILILSLTVARAGSAGATPDGRMAIFDARISPDGNLVAFSWSGDIWVADVGSGDCRRVTDHVAYDHHPAWFPGSDRLAFSSNRDGNDDVYSVSINGGEPTRHTWHDANDVVQDVAPDGEHILFSSSRWLFSIDLYEVDIHGGLERPITHDTSRNFEARYSPDGESIVVSRGIFDWTRRAYNGSGDTDIYVMDRSGLNMRWVENGYDGIDYWPAIIGDSIYFVSDRDLGKENVFRIPRNGGPAQRLTDFRDRPVLFLSVANTGRICFIQDFKLWVMDSDQSPPRPIDLDCSTEPKHNQEVRLDIAGSVTEMALSPLGTHLAVIARGELFIIPLHDPNEPAPLGDERYWQAVRITETPSREQYVAWHPDGDRVALSSDRDGNYEIYEIDLRTLEWTRLTTTEEDEITPQYSPDGKSLAFYRGNTDLVVMDLQSQKSRTLAKSTFVFLPWIGPYQWSPDGRWIAYTAPDPSFAGEVFIASAAVDDPGPVNITVHHDNDILGGWAPDGKSVYFMSRRNYEVGLEGYGWWWEGGTLHSIPLQNEPPPASDVLFPAKTENEDKTEGDESAPPVDIDFKRIDERAWQVTHIRGGGDKVALSPDGKTYVFESNALGGRALWSVPFEGGDPTQIASLPDSADDIEWLPDGRGVIYLSANRIEFWDKDSGKVMPVPTTGRLTVDLNKERREMVYETGRVFGNHFYDPRMHGYDWNLIVSEYAPLAEETATGEEFMLLMKMMFGEIDASHTGAYTGGSSEGIGMGCADLGLEFDPTTTPPGLLVTYVLPRGPADYDETRIEPGEWVLSIDGVDVSPADNFWALLDDAVSRTTVLKVASDQAGTDARDVSLLPMTRGWASQFHESWGEAEYETWVERNRARVEEMSNGKIGYVHIQAMGGSRLERFARELFAENMDKDALIVDIRWNPGGNIHEYLLDILGHTQFGWSRPRDADWTPQPSQIWSKPTVLLINERSSSDSEIFPQGFRTLGLGTIIGETTLGAVIGTEEYTLIDGTTGIRLPMEGWYAMDRTNLENYGVPPDIRVVNDLNHIRDGVDDQLEYAVRHLLDQLE